MVKNKKFWTPTKIIVTILIAIFFFFILFNLGVFDSIASQFLATSGDPSAISRTAGFGGSS